MAWGSRAFTMKGCGMFSSARRVLRFCRSVATCAALSLGLIGLASHDEALANNHVIQVDLGAELIDVSLTMGRAVVLESSTNFAEVTVANPEVADVAPLSQTNIYVLAKKIGRTNLTVLDENGQIVAVVDLRVSPDLTELKSRLNELLPGEKVEVRSAAEGLVLSGQISGAAKLASAMMLAEHYAPGNVTNMMAVRGSQQVMLKVRFVELQRSTAKQLGLNFGLENVSGDVVTSLISGIANPDAFGVGAVARVAGNFTLNAVLDALEDKGQLRTLAEPNLVALSGDEASFLAGGEIPIPVGIDDDDDGDTEVEIEFKKFGIGLSFTPTVVDGDLINLEMITEVSSVDPNLTVTGSNGLNIPGFVVRRANTTIEMQDGQSFAIAGLLQENFRDQVQAVSLAGGCPSAWRHV